MAAPPEDRRPPMAVAMEWVSKITTVAVMMVLPAFAGYWADNRWGTGPWLLILGAAFGSTLFFVQLLQMVERPRDKRGDGSSSD